MVSGNGVGGGRIPDRETANRVRERIFKTFPDFVQDEVRGNQQ